MAILTVPISLTLGPYTKFYELRNASGLYKIYTSFLRDYCMRPVSQEILSPGNSIAVTEFLRKYCRGVPERDTIS